MDDTNDSPSYSSTSTSPTNIFQPNQISKIIDICYEGSSFVGFIISVIQIFMLGSFGNSSSALISCCLSFSRNSKKCFSQV